MYGVNSPKKYTMVQHTCSYIFKSGVNKGKSCNCAGFLYLDEISQKTSCFCFKHWTCLNKSKNKKEKSNNKIKTTKNTPTYTELEDLLNKKYRVVDLKNILRENKQKLSGNKYDLIKRVISKNIF